MTIGIQFHFKDIEMDGITYSLHLWDFAGQDRWRFMQPPYTFGADGAMIFYDTTRMSTLDQLEEWVGIARTYNRDVPILFCGTKLDLEQERSVSSEHAKFFLEPLGMFEYIEISSKTGENVGQAFEILVRKIIEQRKRKA